MEPIEFQHGPLAPGLPAGLRLTVTLDGDVVSGCVVTAELSVDGDPVPDPPARAAWNAAAAGETTWEQIAEVERERALNHLTWLRSLSRLVGWAELTGRCQAAVDGLLDERTARMAGAPPARSVAPVQKLERLVRSRRMRSRTAGVGGLGDDVARDLCGPNARAAGLARDARTDDPAYAALGFEPVVEDGADAYARCLARVRETGEALRLAQRALERSAAGERCPTARAEARVVEGPRGPVSVGPDGDRVAPGGREALAAAGSAAVGSEWASALVGIASFDLSPWRTGT
jgi:hypothetical protein